MKIKLGELLNINQILKQIIDNEKDIDSLLKFKLLGIMKSIENHVVNFEIIKNEKIIQYGKEKDDGNIRISPEDKEALQKFNEDLLPIINSDIEISVDKLKADNVFDKGVKSDYLIGLYPIIEE